MIINCYLTLALLLLSSTSLHAKNKPLWEFGLGVGDVNFPAYRGSSERRNFVLPTPYFVYRGTFLKADRSGLRSVFFDSDWVELNLSGSASTPVNSEHIHVRAGMPDLKPTAELGPSLDFHLWRSAIGQYKVDLRVPLRYAFTLETESRSVGWQFTPRLTWDVSDPAGFNGWNLGLLTGPVYGSTQQHDYFYTVQQRYATAEREAYTASSGYAGWQVLGALSKRFPHYWVGGFIRYDSLQGAVFADSPLVTSPHYFAGGIAISWLIAESKTRVSD